MFCLQEFWTEQNNISSVFLFFTDIFFVFADAQGTATSAYYVT